MTMILLIQIALISLAMADEPCKGNHPPGWWFPPPPSPITYNPCQSVSTTCLLKSQPVVRRDDYTYTPGIGGHKVHTRPLTWPAARQTCEEEGGHLAIVNSIAESNAITELFKKTAASGAIAADEVWAFIGFHDLYQEGEYMTIHGQTLARAGFTQWAPGQPDNAYGGENCGCVYINGGLADIVCSSVHPFICEIPNYQECGKN